ncbi:MAG: DNA repair exonuclease [Nitrososphaeria archaeon]
MRILHSSDLHLSERKPETIDALAEILNLAKDLSVDVLTLSGDIFDSPEDAEVLRPRLRRMFSGNNFKIIAIPGNHDFDAYRANLDFGSDLYVVVKAPFEVLDLGDANIVALPYTSSCDERLLSRLKEASNCDKCSVLLVHCTLDIGFSFEDFGEDEGYSYFPISKSILSVLGFDYVLAGHFHKTTTRISLGDKGEFVYPGSPVSLSTKETGRRNVVFVDTVNGTCKPVPLKSFYYDELDITVTPGKEDHAIKSIEEWVRERLDDNCSLKIVVKGFIERDETTFRNEIKNVAGKAVVDHEYKNVKHVLEHPLYLMFKKKLMAKDIENKDEVEERVIEAFSILISSGDLKD